MSNADAEREPGGHRSHGRDDPGSSAPGGRQPGGGSLPSASGADAQLERGAANDRDLLDPGVVEAVRAELDQEMASVEARASSLDTKSGLLLGFAGALLALTVGDTGWATLLAQVFATGTAGSACLAIMPVIGRTIGPAALLERYWHSTPAVIKQQALINRIGHHTEDEKRLKRKRKLFLTSAWCLGAATALLLAAQLETRLSL